VVGPLLLATICFCVQVARSVQHELTPPLWLYPVAALVCLLTDVRLLCCYVQCLLSLMCMGNLACLTGLMATQRCVPATGRQQQQ
jgi:hypothetical protein